MDKEKIYRDFRAIVKGKFSRKGDADFNFIHLDDAELARAIHSSNNSSDFEGKYDPWANLTEWDGGLRLSAVEGISVLKRSFFLDLTNTFVSYFDNFILQHGGFPGGTVESSEIAENFLAIFLYAMSTIDSGKTERLYEEMFLAYQSGGWPCGWYGKYPEGQLVVFYPS